MIVDGHVHIHPCFDIRQMLDAAWVNFRRVDCADAAYFMALSESRSHDYFSQLQQLAKSGNVGERSPDLGDWEITLTGDRAALLATKRKARPMRENAGNTADDDCAAIYILAGRQIVTSENLEVLALATEQPFGDGCSIEETVQLVSGRGGIPVIPWGFGKWVGRRGQYLRDLLEAPPAGLFLADSSSRPSFWPEPPLFEQARQKGLAILSGTDPFPLVSERGRAGVAGFKVTGLLDPAKPATSLRQVLSSASQASVYGPLETPFRCVRNQVAMQFIKRFRSHA